MVGALGELNTQKDVDAYAQVLSAPEKPMFSLYQPGWGQDKVEIIITLKAGLKNFSTIGIKSSDKDLSMMPQSW